MGKLPAKLDSTEKEGLVCASARCRAHGVSACGTRCAGRDRLEKRYPVESVARTFAAVIIAVLLCRASPGRIRDHSAASRSVGGIGHKSGRNTAPADRVRCFLPAITDPTALFSVARQRRAQESRRLEWNRCERTRGPCRRRGRHSVYSRFESHGGYSHSERRLLLFSAA
jgi:hypothetical protein